MGKKMKHETVESNENTVAAILVSPLSILVDENWNSRSGKWFEDESYVGVEDEKGVKSGGLLQAIRKDGAVLTPLDVRPTTQQEKEESGKDYFLVTGFRRIRAAIQLEFALVPVCVKEMSEAAARLRNLQENSLRENLNVPDTTWIIKKLDGSATQQEIAITCGLKQSYISKLARIAKGLTNEVFDAWRRASISVSVVEMLALSEIPRDQQMEKFAAMMAAATTGKTRKGKGSWLETTQKRVSAFGFQIGVLVRKGIVGHVVTSVGELDPDDVNSLGVKINSKATQQDKESILATFVNSIETGAKAKVDTAPETIESDDVLNQAV
jgi:ParB/RepB/Spo0J family partition protein